MQISSMRRYRTGNLSFRVFHKRCKSPCKDDIKVADLQEIIFEIETGWYSMCKQYHAFISCFK